MSDDEVPYSRLFIVGPKTLQEDEVRNEFKEFGNIRDIKIVKDRTTGENKGIYYVRYTKTSHAAKALEEMKGKNIGGSNIKVMIASSRQQGSVRDDNEEDHVKRLFVVVPKTAVENELYDYFKLFGELAYISIIKNKETKQSKGFAYVKYNKFSDAAKAYEECERKFKPKFAEPKRPSDDFANSYNKNSYHSAPQDPPYRSSMNDGGPRHSSPFFKEDGVYKLSVVASPAVNQDQMWKLFDIVPSLDFCQIRYDHGHRQRAPQNNFEVVYTNSEWAMYAVEKFHGFEYPPGQRLIVKLENQQSSMGGGTMPVKRSAASLGEPSGIGSPNKPDLMQLAETIAQASSLIKAAGLNPDLLQPKLGRSDPINEEGYCSVPLPEAKPLLHIDTKTEARCFVICFPQTLSPGVLKDIFCRFGSLIDVYMLHNKNCGYAKYASKESAEAAIKTLHGAEVLGTRLKVFEAEERPDKRQRLDADGN